MTSGDNTQPKDLRDSKLRKAPIPFFILKNLKMENMQPITQSTTQNSAIEVKKIRRSINMEDLFRLMSRNWLLFLLCICLSLLFAFVYLHNTPSIYERVLDLEVKNSHISLQSDFSAMGASAKNDPSAEMENVMYVFRSLKLAREVSERLRLDVAYYNKGTLGNQYLYEDRPFTIHFNDTYRQDVRLCIRPTSAQTFLVLFVEQNGKKKELPNDVPPYFFGSPLRLPEVDEEVELTVDTKNYDYLMSSLNEDVIVERTSLDKAAERCQSMVSADLQTNSVVRVSCRASSVREADDILHAITSIYNTQVLSAKMRVIDNSVKFIEERIEEAAISDSLVMADKIMAFDQSYKTEYMQYLLRRREDLMLQKAVIEDETRVIEDPMGGTDPISPVANRVFLYFLAAGIIASFFLLLIIALFKNTVRGRKFVESVHNMPLGPSQE